MKIAVPSYSPGGLKAQVCPHLGHAECLTIVEVEDHRPMKVEVIDCKGPHYGFTRRPVEVLASIGVDAVAVKGLGVRALEFLNQAGVRVYKVTADIVEDAIRQVVTGESEPISSEEACPGKGYDTSWRSQWPGTYWSWPPPPPMFPFPTTLTQRPMRITGRLRVAIACQGRGGLDDLVSPMFGRCPTFTIVDVEEGEIKNVQVIQNQAMYVPHGAGIAAVQTLANLGVRLILAGRFGPWASQATMQFGIQTIAVPPGIKVKDAIYRYVLGR